MRFRTTLFLLVVVAVLFGVVKWLDREGATVVEDGPDPLLGEFHAQLVHRLELELATREDLQLETRGRDWWLVGPLVDHARQSTVESLIEVLLQNPRVRVADTPDARDLARFGLEPPQARVTLIGDGGTKRLSLRVGERDPAGTLVYVKIEGDESVYQTGANLKNVLERARQEWRADRFVTGDGALVRRVEFTRPGKPRLVAERQTGVDWTLLEPRVYPGDNGKLSQLVNGLLLLDVQNFTEANPSPERRIETNLADTATVATLDFGNRKVELRFGTRQVADPDSPRFATDSERGHLFVVRGPVLSMLDLGDEEFRDKRIARFAPGDVTSLRLTRRNGVPFELAFRAAERRFYFVQPFEGPCNDARNSPLRALFTGIASLEARANDGFLDPEELPSRESGVDPIAALGFDDPAYVIEIETTDAVRGARKIRIEATDDDGTGHRFVRRTDQDASPIWLVDSARVATVGDSDPRPFLDPELLPEDLENYERVVIRLGDRVREIRRTGSGRERVWSDPNDSNARTSDVQEYVAGLAGLEALRFLPRDAAAEDGLSPPYATIEFHFSGARAKEEPITLRIGAIDETGKLVRIASSRFDSRRAVAECERRIRDPLAALFP